MRSSPEFDLTMHCSTIFCGLQTMSQSIYIWIGQIKPLKSTSLWKAQEEAKQKLSLSVELCMGILLYTSMAYG